MENAELAKSAPAGKGTKKNPVKPTNQSTLNNFFKKA